jgi:DnaK suppressor protein
MTDAKRARFRLQLEALRAEILSHLEGEASTAGSITPDNAIGRLTRMEAIQSRAMDDEGRRRQAARLPRIERALRRIEEGAYGRCIRCGEDIPLGRLEAMPEVAHCVGCAARG